MSSHVASRKRKERDDAPSKPAEPGAAPAGSRLLAGYLAHEFLTRGTLLGRRLGPDPTGSGSGPPPAVDEPGPTAVAKSPKTYHDVACLLMGDGGAHIPGIVNPTQLARWLHL